MVVASALRISNLGAACRVGPATPRRLTVVMMAADVSVRRVSGTMQRDVLDFRGALVTEVLPFWERSVDREYGGFITDLDAHGTRFGAGDKHLVMQARMIYSFSLGHRLTGNPDYLAHARQGVAFLRSHFSDAHHGGWFRTTTRQGEPSNRDKWPYGIAFVAYALAEYARAGGDPDALHLAHETFDLLWGKAWDQARGGIFWNLNPDWSPADPTKRIDSMLHTMEAASSLLAATGEQRYLDRLNEICETIMQRTYDPRFGCTREWFTPDWQEATERTRGLINYGHIAEAAWFISVVGAFTNNESQLTFGRSLLGFVLRQGWDAQHGGIYAYGRPEGLVVDTTKVWWMQAELLGGLSFAYRLTGDVLYRDWLRQQARFVMERQREASVGEWRASLYADGTVLDGRTGSPSKAAYHVVQALVHADANLAAAGTVDRAVRPGVGGVPWDTLAL